MNLHPRNPQLTRAHAPRPQSRPHTHGRTRGQTGAANRPIHFQEGHSPLTNAC